MRISRSNMALTGRLVEEVQLCVIEINESDLINRQNDNGLEKSEKRVRLKRNLEKRVYKTQCQECPENLQRSCS